MSNREIIEWLRKKAETMPMPGARKMYEAAAKAIEAAQPEHGTNLAEVGTDCISRQAVIDAVNRLSLGETDAVRLSMRIADYLNCIPPAQPTFDARDTQYNLPIGKDLISRAAAIDDIWTVSPLARLDRKWVDRWLRQLPPAQPEIIRCRNCKFASGDSRICMKFGHSPIGELDFCAWAERRTDG